MVQCSPKWLLVQKCLLSLKTFKAEFKVQHEIRKLIKMQIKLSEKLKNTYL